MTAGQSSATRPLASRIELRDGELRLHTIWRAIRVDRSQVAGVARARFLGWDVLALKLSSDRSVRLPLLTQPGDPIRLGRLEEVLVGQLRPESGL
jgi:hypothetical protein